MRGIKVEKCYSLKELTEQGTTAPVEPGTGIRFYIRAAQQLFKQAKIYQLEGDLQTAYIYYMRLCNLVVYELSKHPEFGQPEYKTSILSLKKNAVVAMTQNEAIKPVLEKKHQEYQQYIKHREETLQAQIQAQVQAVQAIDMHRKHSEIRLRNESDRAAKERHDLEWASMQPVQGWSLAKALEGVPGLNAPQTVQQRHGNHHDYNAVGGVGEIQYPEYHRQHHPRSDVSAPTITRPQPLTPTPTGLPPALPKKPVTQSIAPKLPPKIHIEEDVHEFSQGLRTLIVPVRLLDRFLNIVRPNTNRKLETCGILAGVLSHNKLTVTTLIIPKQTATSDTCSTTNEDELFEYQIERDLMTLGWIHTHPTQTCFMSSVDLHTHCSYQLMLPEAIAIVCAPSHEKDYGVFRLTDPPGLQVITNCRQKPLFHQHPGEDDIYTDACDQGHVQLIDLDLDIVDLRGK
ncbi:hypothetical protein BGZ95_010003 [Linnemannia exigua]|uniref:MPN domain-containing protein n=1 Tax=Linnemannia exigua TaxID=604196 RepID=A0AAD4DCK0_9FUNG|nr:hypothetical protein BGZ95_010003 [Linnemannia exigua]